MADDRHESQTAAEHAAAPAVVLKLVPAASWRQAEAEGVFHGAPVDLADGFIHFSTGAQVAETARRHFRGVADLLVVAVAATRLGAALRFEPSRGGDLFPHLYAPLPLSAVVAVAPLADDGCGGHRFPAEIAGEPIA